MAGSRLQTMAPRIDAEIQDWLRTTGVDEAKPKDVMPHLVDRGIFPTDHKEGLPLRKFLRELDDANLLSLMPTVQVERKKTNRFWYFRLPNRGPA